VKLAEACARTPVSNPKTARYGLVSTAGKGLRGGAGTSTQRCSASRLAVGYAPLLLLSGPCDSKTGARLDEYECCVLNPTWTWTSKSRLLLMYERD